MSIISLIVALKHRGKSRHIIYIPTTNVWLKSRALNILSISSHRTCIPSADVLVKIRGRHRTYYPYLVTELVSQVADVLVKVRGSYEHSAHIRHRTCIPSANVLVKDTCYTKTYNSFCHRTCIPSCRCLG